MSRALPCAAALAALFLALPAAGQSQRVLFAEANGLEAEAEFTLLGGGTQLEVRLRNRTSMVPMGFSNSDQILTGVSFDLGMAGENPGDPAIVSGVVVTGPSSSSVDFDVMNVGPGDDVSGEYGFGNGGTTMTHPNFVSGNQSAATPFGGPNLDGPDNLSGPQGGLISAVYLSLSGLGAIQDEIIATLDLSMAIADLSFLENGVRIEYGSDADFLDNCEETARNIIIEDPLGLNAPGSLFPDGSAVPTIGTPAYIVKMDDAMDQCGITPGTQTWVFVNESPAISVVLPNFGCAPGQPGNLMIDVTDPMTHSSGPVIWNGPGDPACHSFRIADVPALCGIICRGQGFWLDPTGDSGPIILTNRVEFVLGP